MALKQMALSQTRGGGVGERAVSLSFQGLIPGPFFSAIALFKSRICFPRGFGGFLERRIPGKNGEVTPRLIALCILNQS